MAGRSAWNEANEAIISCARCPRLVAYCAEVAATKRAAYRDEAYWGKPVPNFGDRRARLLIVGLAPGAHGANRTGRMFTGDRSGDFLFRALYETGFSDSATSTASDDGLSLEGAAITAAVHCAPPGNRPTGEEFRRCAGHLESTFDTLGRLKGVVALGKLAFDATIRFYKGREWLDAGAARAFHFGHGAAIDPPGAPFLLASYHPSQQNTFTGRLTQPMLRAVFRDAARRIAGAAAITRRGKR